jgi:hypothetical protein
MKGYNNIAGKNFLGLIRDEALWNALEELKTILKPVCDANGKMERDDSLLSDVYSTFLDLLDNPVLGRSQAIRDVIQDRWNFLHTESMGFAYILDPRTMGGERMIEQDIIDTSRQLTEYLIMANPTASKTSIDQEVNGYLHGWVNAVDSRKEFAKDHPPLVTWYSLFKAKYPMLYEVAKRSLTTPTSSAASERVWSVFGLIHSKKRSRLLSENAMKLAQVYINTSIMRQSKGSKIDYFAQALQEAGPDNQGVCAEEYSDTDEESILVDSD